MNRVFSPDSYITVRDGTQVCAFLNPTDPVRRDVPRALRGVMSIAAGRIAPGSRSHIHVHPAVTQVTYVTAGTLCAKMQDGAQPEPYQLIVPAGSAVVSEPGTLLQLCNETEADLELLYIVSPPYVLEIGDDARVRHDDSVVVAEDWNELESLDWRQWASATARRAARRRRSRALRRMSTNRR